MDSQLTFSIDFLSRDEVQEYLLQISDQHQLDLVNLEKLFLNLKPDPLVIDAINYSFENYAPWYLYYQHYVTEDRIMTGLSFWQQHESFLQLVEEDYQVPAKIILGILGIETCYGLQIDAYNVLRSLATLAFNYPRRSQYFKEELTAFLLLTRKFDFTLTSLKGTYTGAFGLFNAMPTNYFRYAKSYKNNQRVDIYDPEDAIVTIANFFKRYREGWMMNLPIAIPVEMNQDVEKISIKSQGNHTLAEFKDLNIYPKEEITLPSETKLNLLTLTSGPNGEQEFWFTSYNFYQIYGYNPGAVYVMAVYHLAQRLSEIFK